jgi:hypothetical protein
MVVALMAATGAPLASRSLAAQAVLGIGEDALGVPRGHVRLTIGTSWTRFDRVFDADGDLVSFAAPLTRDTLGADALESLRPLESSLRALSGLPGARVSLGSSITSVDAWVATTPIMLEGGITNRLTIGVMLPIVQARTTPQLSVNPSATGGNISLNPATNDAVIQTENTQFFLQLQAAQTQLGALITACLAGSGDPRCPAALAQGPALQSEAIPFGADLQTLFAGTFVPLVGSAPDAAMRQRLLGFATLYNTLLGTPIITRPGPVGATLTFSTADLQALLTGSDYAYRTFTRFRRQGIGDVEVHGRLLLVNTLPGDARLRPERFGLRFAVGGLVRLGTGTPESPDDLSDVATGDGQNDIEARAASDLVFGRRAWLSLAGRYGWQLADEQIMRVSPRSQPFAPLYTRRTVSRDLGDYIELEATPRLNLSRYFMLGAQYLYRRKAEDRHTGSFLVTNLAGENITLDASVLDAGTKHEEHRLTAGVVFSTVAAYRERRARWPIEISYRHGETLTGSGGLVPKAVVESIEARFYVRLFGPDDRPRGAAAPR